MPIVISEEKMRAIDAVGYGISGTTGGLYRTTYYTPDGRIIKAIPNLRERVKKDKEGKVVWQGIVDANLYRGLLLSPPQVLKPFCPTCDRWHDTLEEVSRCKKVEGAKIAKFEKQAKADLHKEALNKDLKIEALEKKVAELAALVKKMVEVPLHG